MSAESKCSWNFWRRLKHFHAHTRHGIDLLRRHTILWTIWEAPKNKFGDPSTLQIVEFKFSKFLRIIPYVNFLLARIYFFEAGCFVTDSVLEWFFGAKHRFFLTIALLTGHFYDPSEPPKWLSRPHRRFLLFYIYIRRYSEFSLDAPINFLGDRIHALDDYPSFVKRRETVCTEFDAFI